MKMIYIFSSSSSSSINAYSSEFPDSLSSSMPIIHQFCNIFYTVSSVRQPLKLVDQFAYLGSNISSTENDVNMQLAKVWAVIDS